MRNKPRFTWIPEENDVRLFFSEEQVEDKDEKERNDRRAEPLQALPPQERDSLCGRECVASLSVAAVSCF
jgi:hypothetical protein